MSRIVGILRPGMCVPDKSVNLSCGGGGVSSGPPRARVADPTRSSASGGRRVKAAKRPPTGRQAPSERPGDLASQTTIGIETLKTSVGEWPSEGQEEPAFRHAVR